MEPPATSRSRRLSENTPQRALIAGAAALFTVYLALSGGGYDIVVRSELGIVIWWLVLLGVAIGFFPRLRLTPSAWAASALFAAFLAWTWIGLSWSGSHELTLAEVARLATYLGAFVLTLAALERGDAEALIAGLGAGIAIVGAAAVLSKLIPSLFPADTASAFYATARLSYPFDYADAVGEFSALGLPVLFYLATVPRSVIARALATAFLPVVLLCIGMTVSRGGILAVVVGLGVMIALLPDRIAKLPTLALVFAATAVMMAALLSRPALRDQLGVAPAAERHSMLVICVVVLIVTGIAQLGLTIMLRRRSRPRWLRVSRTGALAVTATMTAVLAALVVLAAANGTWAHLWHDFKQPNPSTHANQYFRLLSVAGSHRYQYWQVALRAFDSQPLHGIGPGTFRFYWAQHQTLGEYVLNAHSLWIETLAEEGIVGAALLVGFFLTILLTGAVKALRCTGAARARLAIATAAVCAFCAAAAFDWVWQIGVIPMLTLALAALIVSERVTPREVSITAGAQPAQAGPPPDVQADAEASEDGFSGPPTVGFTSPPRQRPRASSRVILGLAAVLAICLIAVPLASTIEIRNSQAAAAAGDLQRALRDASSAQQIEPGAASPWLQRALLLEQAGDLPGATTAIQAAIARAPADAQLWLVASRLATESNQPALALRDYRRARALDPKSPIFG